MVQINFLGPHNDLSSFNSLRAAPDVSPGLRSGPEISTGMGPEVLQKMFFFRDVNFFEKKFALYKPLLSPSTNGVFLI